MVGVGGGVGEGGVGGWGMIAHMTGLESLRAGGDVDVSAAACRDQRPPLVHRFGEGRHLELFQHFSSTSACSGLQLRSGFSAVFVYIYIHMYFVHTCLPLCIYIYIHMYDTYV